MAIIFDPKKNAKNIAERGLSFQLAEQLEWHTADVKKDTRKDYGETRLQVLACLDGRLYAVMVTPRDTDLRVISFRKANKKERDQYGKKN